MKLTIDQKGNIKILHLHGNLDADSVSHFKRAADQIVASGCFQIVMDCQTMAFIDSIGLGALISLLRKVRTNQGDLKVSGLNQEVRSVFEITRLHRLFDIHQDWQSACAKF